MNRIKLRARIEPFLSGHPTNWCHAEGDRQTDRHRQRARLARNSHTCTDFGPSNHLRTTHHVI